MSEARQAEARAEAWHAFMGLTQPDVRLLVDHEATIRRAHEHGFDEAWRKLTGKGYTPRSMLRAQASTQGICPICGAPSAGERQVDREEEESDAN